MRDAGCVKRETDNPFRFLIPLFGLLQCRCLALTNLFWFRRARAGESSSLRAGDSVHFPEAIGRAIWNSAFTLPSPRITPSRLKAELQTGHRRDDPRRARFSPIPLRGFLTCARVL